RYLSNQYGKVVNQKMIASQDKDNDEREWRMINLTINGQLHELDVPEQMPLLWALRDIVRLTGTKFGCGVAQCGACTVHMNGEAVRSCTTTVAQAQGSEITTIEAIADDA